MIAVYGIDGNENLKFSHLVRKYDPVVTVSKVSVTLSKVRGVKIFKYICVIFSFSKI